MSNQTLFTVIWFNSLALFLPVAMLILWRRPQWWLTLLTLFLGVLTDLIYIRSDELQLSVLLLLVFGFFSGFAQPKHAWRWALMLGIWFPALEAVTLLGGIHLPFQQNVLAATFGFIPALIGAYAGALIARASGACSPLPSGGEGRG